MRWRYWKKWFKEKPWLLKWFVLLVLLRPIIDNFYYLKEISPLLSPLYIVGVLTPVLCLLTIFRYKVRQRSIIDKLFGYWSAALLLGCFLLFMFDPFSMQAMESVLKLSLPAYLFYFLRRFVRSQGDLDGILQTVLYAGIIVAGVLVYELTSGPIRTEESRGLARIQGNFGDVVSYGIYIALASLAAGYFYFRDKLAGRPIRRSISICAAVAVISVVALVNMHHVASYTVFAMTVGLFVLYNMKVNKAVGVGAMVVVGLFVIYFGQQVLESSITPLLETDMKVYAGEQDTSKLMHGRVGRWMFMFDLLSEQNVLVQMLGYPLTFEYAFHLVGIGAHNDFIRLLFFTGYLGLLVYVLLLFNVWRRARYLPEHHRFLVTGIMMATVLYAISTTPTMYAPFVYILMAVFAYVALPLHRKMTYAKTAGALVG